MITSTTRRCSACNALFEQGDTVCASCGRAQPPAVDDWGPNARRLIVLLCLVDMLATHLHCTEQQLFELLLVRTMKGRWYPDGRMLSHSANAAECYVEFARLYQRWEVAGEPVDFATVARISGRRDRYAMPAQP